MATAEQQVLQIVDEHLNDFIDRVFQLSQENLVEDNKIDTSNLLRTGNVNKQFLKKEIVYPAPYADDVEFGRTPGTMPPPDALIRWVQRKLGIGDEKEARRVAFAVALSIKRRGIQAVFYLDRAFKQAKREFGLKGA